MILEVFAAFLCFLVVVHSETNILTEDVDYACIGNEFRKLQDRSNKCFMDETKLTDSEKPVLDTKWAELFTKQCSGKEKYYPGSCFLDLDSVCDSYDIALSVYGDKVIDAVKSNFEDCIKPELATQKEVMPCAMRYIKKDALSGFMKAVASAGNVQSNDYKVRCDAMRKLLISLREAYPAEEDYNDFRYILSACGMKADSRQKCKI